MCPASVTSTPSSPHRTADPASPTPNRLPARARRLADRPRRRVELSRGTALHARWLRRDRPARRSRPLGHRVRRRRRRRDVQPPRRHRQRRRAARAGRPEQQPRARLDDAADGRHAGGPRPRPARPHAERPGHRSWPDELADGRQRRRRAPGGGGHREPPAAPVGPVPHPQRAARRPRHRVRRAVARVGRRQLPLAVGRVD